jgi:hypothetical protein
MHTQAEKKNGKNSFFLQGEMPAGWALASFSLVLGL